MRCCCICCACICCIFCCCIFCCIIFCCIILRCCICICACCWAAACCCAACCWAACGWARRGPQRWSTGPGRRRESECECALEVPFVCSWVQRCLRVGRGEVRRVTRRAEAVIWGISLRLPGRRALRERVAGHLLCMG